MSSVERGRVQARVRTLGCGPSVPRAACVILAQVYDLSSFCYTEDGVERPGSRQFSLPTGVQVSGQVGPGVGVLWRAVFLPAVPGGGGGVRKEA